MEVLKAFLFIFLFFPGLYAANDFPISICGNNGFPIRFPFRLSPQKPQTCGYPGFTLGCNSQGMTLLNLPSSGDFLISSINYRTQVVELKDPYKCLSRRLLELNLSGSPFKAAYYLNYTFLSCPPEFISSRFTTIDCLSNSTSTVLATSSTSLVNSLTICKKIGTSLVPVSRPFQFDDGLSSDLNYDLELTWSVPNCDNCEGNGGLCVFKNSTSIEAICSYNTQTGTKGVRIFKIMALCIAVPMILTSFGIAMFICFMDRRQVGVHPNIRLQNLTTTAAELAAEFESETTTAAGLDETTIDSYAKVIVGESRRLPGPNHITCPICLSDYHAKETLRCIPECQHCFHSECIDEWLRLKGTCPVCRNSPSPAHVNS